MDGLELYKEMYHCMRLAAAAALNQMTHQNFGAAAKCLMRARRRCMELHNGDGDADMREAPSESPRSAS